MKKVVYEEESEPVIDESEYIREETEDSEKQKPEKKQHL